MLAYKINRPILMPLSARTGVIHTGNNIVFALQSREGKTAYDSINGVGATTVVSGTRYGIVDGAVTQFAVNQPPIEDSGLRGCPAFTQLARMSDVLTDGVWTKTRVLTPVLYGSINGVNLWTIAEDTSLNTHNIPQGQLSSIVDNSVLGFCGIFKYNGRHLEVRAQRKDASSATVCVVNLQTGSASGVLSGAIVNVLNLGDGFFRVFCALSVLSGASNPRIYPQLHDGTTGTYLGDGSSGFLFAQPTYIDFGLNGNPFIPPYVINNTTGFISVVSEAATATTGTSFDLDNVQLSRLKSIMRGPQGHLEVTLKSNTDSSWWANNSTYNVLSINNTASSVLYINKDSGGVVSFRTTDGSNIASVSQALTIGTSYKILIDWGTHSTGQKIRITVNGVKSDLVSCGASLGLEDLSFFDLSGIHIGWIVKDSLKITDRPQW